MNFQFSTNVALAYNSYIPEIKLRLLPIQTINILKQNKMNYQRLFDYMCKEHGVTLLEEDMQEIVNIVNEMQSVCDECDGTGLWKENETDKEQKCPKCSNKKQTVVEEYKQWLEQQIELCLNDKDLQREHWAFCKAYEKLTALCQPIVSGRSEQLSRKSCNHACSPSDFYEGGKCDNMGCYKG